MRIARDSGGFWPWVCQVVGDQKWLVLHIAMYFADLHFSSESPSTSKKGVTIGFNAKENKSTSFPCDFTECIALKEVLDCLYTCEYGM